MSLGRLLWRRCSMSISSGGGLINQVEHSCCTPAVIGGTKFFQLLPTTTGLTVDFRRGVKTTDTTHPQPVYDEDEKVLRRVMEERDNCSEDLPIGMSNPFEKPQRKCILCENGITPNYKNVKLLYQFVSPYTGMKYERHVTGLCRKKQAEVNKEIDNATTFGLMSNYTKPVEFLKDPKLCDPERPVKPHKY